jgi:hypothetical protein
VGSTEESRGVTAKNAKVTKQGNGNTKEALAAQNAKSERETMRDIKALCNKVRQIAYDIHLYHGHGHLDKVYENALSQCPLTVSDEDGTVIGDYLADLLVEGVLVVE